MTRSRSLKKIIISKLILRVDARRPPIRRSLAGSERTSSQSTQIAKQNRNTEEPERAGGVVLGALRLRARDLAKRGEAQGGRRRRTLEHTIRHVYGRRRQFCFSKKSFNAFDPVSNLFPVGEYWKVSYSKALLFLVFIHVFIDLFTCPPHCIGLYSFR